MKPRATPEWAWVGLFAILVFCVWWRGHTFGPTVRDLTNGGIFWPVVRGATEPLDCDEAAYAYMGRRMLAGDVLYRDLVENKPPGGYWIYALAVAIGGANEWTVRLLPVPIVLLTLIVVWKLATECAGPAAGCIAALIYVLMSTDPYLYGNGAQLELPLNLWSVVSLWLLTQSARGRLWICAAGAALGAAALVRQTALVNLPLYALWLWLARRRSAPTVAPRPILWLALGFGIVVGGALLALVARGAGPAFLECVVQGGAALVTDTPSPANAPPLWTRWLTGNADPQGHLPPPFGTTDYLVWWGGGSWPLWIAGAVAVAWLLFRSTQPHARLIATWTLAACFQVVLPRQFWAHYYLLPTPGIALAVAIVVSEWTTYATRRWRDNKPGAALALLGTAALIASLGFTTYLQVRDYLLERPTMLTVRYKGGQQWVRLRALGTQMRQRARNFDDPKLFIWGWQSPLYIYSQLDAPCRHFFVNDLMRSQADRNHPLVSRWTREILSDLRQQRPLIIFTGYPPFSGLSQFIRENYNRSNLVPEVPAVWVRSGDQPRFDEADARRSSARSDLELGFWEWLPIPRPTPAEPAGGFGPPRSNGPAIGQPRS